MAQLYAEVVILGTALDKTLHYSIPADLAERVRPGTRVAVHLGNRIASGIVLSAVADPPDLPPAVSLRPILRVADEPPLPGDLLDLCGWISSYYFYPLGEVLALALPARGRERPARPVVKSVRLLRSGIPEGIRPQGKAGQILRLLEAAGGCVPLRDLRAGCGNCDRPLRKLVEAGAVAFEESASAPEERSHGNGPLPPPVDLTEDQAAAVSEIAPLLESPSFQPFVLYGVTGSGKTEVYLRLIEKAVESGRGCLVLVPEIALSAQMETIFRQRFPDILAVWHSALSDRERGLHWLDILSGEKSVVLGARSAVLTPVKDLGLVIVDEEHDGSYKQEDRLRYNARDVGIMRGMLRRIPVVLGSATPSLQTVQRVAQNAYRRVLLPSRVLDRPQPEIEIVDMRREGRGASIFSARLRKAVEQTMAEGRQALLFLNRRGFAKHFLCNACGHVLQCASCSVSLTYHRGEDCLRCHYCGWETTLPERCPACGHAALFPHGFGTEKVEREAQRLFPGARIVRIDRDATGSHESLLCALDSVRSGKADILLGTQMIAKGHDFPNITLVGIINADAGLQVPDFRAGESLVQLLVQVAGRAGRGDTPGLVLLQTYNPFHFTIESAMNMDYDGFCEKELESRKALQYPPFVRLLKLLVTAGRNEDACEGARLLASICREKAGSFNRSGRPVAVLGPSPAAFVKLKNRFRWQIFIKAWKSSDMQSFAEIVLRSVGGDAAFRNVQITVDRDPANEI
ncbi:MAG: primosomal protein N' [Desulfobacteraceae bacterium]|nr:primosomal protein N' [Desulfobacteraceae bacterium]